MLLHDRHIPIALLQLGADLGHPRADRGLGHLGVALGHQPLPNPPRRVPLLRANL